MLLRGRGSQEKEAISNRILVVEHAKALVINQRENGCAVQIQKTQQIRLAFTAFDVDE